MSAAIDLADPISHQSVRQTRWNAGACAAVTDARSMFVMPIDIAYDSYVHVADVVRITA